MKKMMAPNLLRSPAELRLQNIINIVYNSKANGVTRSELSHATGINPTSIVRLTAELLERKLLINEDNQQSPQRRGRPSDILRINHRAGYGVGIEFSRGHLIVVITNAVGEIVSWRTETEVPQFVAMETTIHKLSEIINASVVEAGIKWEEVDALGLALHDMVSARGEWITNENFRDEPFPIQHKVQHILKRRTVVEDVSRAFAEAEHRFGSGKDTLDMAYVFLGSHGVGSGIFVNGQLMKSSSGVCGEIGHIIVEENGPLCYCGSNGCLEIVASHRAVVQQVRVLLEQGVRTTLQDTAHLTFEQICNAAGSGDKIALMVLHRLAKNMATALASVINLAGTPHIVIGGQLSMAGDMFLSALSNLLRHRVIGLYAKSLSVNYAQLPTYAGAWGVAIQAIESFWLSGDALKKPHDASGEITTT